MIGLFKRIKFNYNYKILMFKYEKFDNKMQKEIKKKENKSIFQIFF